MSRACIQCGECMRHCPVFRAYGGEEFSPKAKRLILEPLLDSRSRPAEAAHAGGPDPDISSPASATETTVSRAAESASSATAWKDVVKLARLCAGCGRCRDACPRDLSAADLLAQVRSRCERWIPELWRLWIGHAGPLWPSLGRLAALLPDALVPSALTPQLSSLRSLRPPQDWPWVRIRPENPAPAEPVAIFPGCTARHARPGWTNRARSLLRLWGYQVQEADFGCCGMTLGHAGLLRDQAQCGLDVIELWQGLGRPLLAVFCASCRHGLHEAARQADADQAARFLAAIRPLSALLAHPLSVIDADLVPQSGYHSPCHARPEDPDRDWLGAVLPDLAPGGESCCGMGGVLQLTDPAVSARMGEACRAAFPPGTGCIVTSCGGCALQLDAPHLPALHWLDVVAPDPDPFPAKPVSPGGTPTVKERT